VKYTAVFEKTPSNYSAYVPDLPGCIATGETREDTEANIRGSIALHLRGLREDGDAVPPAETYAPKSMFPTTKSTR
jgi:predicted RNase H-like HicB family nuclease